MVLISVRAIVFILAAKKNRAGHSSMAKGVRT